jgi:hypothetical protein
MVMLIDVKLNVMLSMPSNGNVNWCKTLYQTIGRSYLISN